MQKKILNLNLIVLIVLWANTQFDLFNFTRVFYFLVFHVLFLLQFISVRLIYFKSEYK